jgi:prepilin-type N-terminal cleavage/methylation domain-containing protein
MNGRSHGFTLLEVVVAITLLGLGLTAALELLGLGLRAGQASGDSTRAVILARRALDAVTLRPLGPGSDVGAEGRYRWTAEVAPHGETAEGRVEPVSLYRVRVRVTWPGRNGERAFELVTLRAAADPGAVVPGPAVAGGSVPGPGPARAEGGQR